MLLILVFYFFIVRLFNAQKFQVSSAAIGFQLTVCSYKKLAIFTTNVDVENQCLINHKCICGALNRQFFVGVVMGWAYSKFHISISNCNTHSQ